MHKDADRTRFMVVNNPVYQLNKRLGFADNPCRSPNESRMLLFVGCISQKENFFVAGERFGNGVNKDRGELLRGGKPTVAYAVASGGIVGDNE